MVLDDLVYSLCTLPTQNSGTLYVQIYHKVMPSDFITEFLGIIFILAFIDGWVLFIVYKPTEFEAH